MTTMNNRATEERIAELRQELTERFNSDVNNRINEVNTTVQYHKDIDTLATEYNNVQNFNRTVEATAINVLAGYESKYMNKNDYRFAHKLAHKDSKVLANDEYFNYLAQTATGKVEAQVKEKKVIRESYDFDMTHTEDKLPWTKKAKKSSPVKVAIKKIKKVPSATYLNVNTNKTDREYEFTDNNTHSYRVVAYHWYQKGIVLDLIDTEKEWVTIQRRELLENNEQIIHLVFRYMPYLSNGKPNPKDGITQLREFLLSQKFITEQIQEQEQFKFIRQALDVLTGYTVDIPNFYAYNYTKNSDMSTAFMVYGEFDSIEEQLTANNSQEYTAITEYFERDSDSEEYEKEAQTAYCKETFDDKQSRIIKYDCHKEFRQELPLRYSHVGYIFD